MGTMVRRILASWKTRIALLVVFILIIGGTINLGQWGGDGTAILSQQLSDGPKTSDGIGDGYGTSHSSTVYYTKQTNPFVANVDRIYYGGRKPKEHFGECCGGWRHQQAKYKEWDGSKWVTVKTVNKGS